MKPRSCAASGCGANWGSYCRADCETVANLGRAVVSIECVIQHELREYCKASRRMYSLMFRMAATVKDVPTRRRGRLSGEDGCEGRFVYCLCNACVHASSCVEWARREGRGGPWVGAGAGTRRGSVGQARPCGRKALGGRRGMERDSHCGVRATDLDFNLRGSSGCVRARRRCTVEECATSR